MFGYKRKYQELQSKYQELQSKTSFAIEALIKTHERHAKWEKQVKTYSTDKVYVNVACSECGARKCHDNFTTDHWEEYMKKHWEPSLPLYCDRCGCKMDLEATDEQS